ncbi:MAG: insulinase family protein, partial [Pseudomonadota bacterium]|nr:insulinase family protein [Pseudomonadota bacterium]
MFRIAALLWLILVLPAAAADSPDVLRATLANGMRIIIVPDRLAPVLATSLNYLVGSTDSPPGFPGTAHALEHMMFRGTDGLDRDQLSELGGLLGGAYNASTAETLTQYTYTIPANDLGLVLRIEAGRMRGLTLAPADWAQERGAIEQEVSRNLSNPIYNATAAVQAALFAGTPYEHDALGTRPSFDATDAALLRRFYETWYVPNNAILVIAGDVDASAVLDMARQAFEGIPSRALPPHAAIPPLSPIGSIAPLSIPTNLPYVAAGVAFRMPGLRAAEFASADILGDVLASRRGALYDLVPSGRALAAQFQFQAKADVGLGLAFVALPSGSDPAPALEDLRRVLADAAAGAVPTELIEAAKRQERAQLAFEADSIVGLARTWSRAVAVSGLASPDDLAQAYADVTPESVRQLARRLLDPSQAVTVVLTPRPAGAPAATAAF